MKSDKDQTTEHFDDGRWTLDLHSKYLKSMHLPDQV